MKVIKHLKPYIISLLLICVVLVIQANCDLTLPDKMSAIITVGIQQSGLDSAASPQLSEEDYDLLKLFMDEKEQKLCDKLYSKETLEGKTVFVLNSDISDEDKKAVENAFVNPVMIVGALSSGQMDEMLAEAAEEQKGQQTEMPSQEELAALITSGQMTQAEAELLMQSMSGQTAIPATGKELVELMKSKEIPDEAKKAIVENMAEGIAELDKMEPSLKAQAAISYTKAFAEAGGYDVEGNQIRYIVYAGLLMLGYSAVIMLCSIIVTLLAAKIGSGFSRDLRHSVYEKVIGFSNRELNKFSAASLITRSTNDIQQIQIVMIMVLRMVVYAPIIGFWAFMKALNTGPSMAWVIGLAVLTIFLIALILIVFALPKFTKLQKLVDRINQVSREILTGIPVVRAFAREKHEENRFDGENKTLLKTNLFVNRAMSIMMPAMFFVLNGVSVLIIWTGAGQVDSGNMQVGDLMAFISYTMQIIFAFLMLTMISVMVPRAIVSAKRVSEVLKTEQSVRDPESPQEFGDNVSGEVEFKNVSFKYPGAEEYVLKNISFTASPGKTTAIIGGTGSGKSTLVNLVPRFFDVTDGEILVDGKNISSVRLNELRDKIGYIPQKGLLFSGTIAENIAYSDEHISKEEIETAAEVAQAASFISEKAEGYDSEVAQGGTNVSGGQRQRLAIARAIAKKPEIFIFDDSFSALDFKTETVLRKALKKHTEKSTVLVVAQRISTVLEADKIIMLNNGEAVGIGTHSELLESCEEYREIAESQLSAEELSREAKTQKRGDDNV